MHIYNGNLYHHQQNSKTCPVLCPLSKRYSGLVVFLIKENNPSEVNDRYHFDGNLVIKPKVK